MELPLILLRKTVAGQAWGEGIEYEELFWQANFGMPINGDVNSTAG